MYASINPTYVEPISINDGIWDVLSRVGIVVVEGGGGASRGVGGGGGGGEIGGGGGVGLGWFGGRIFRFG